MGNMVGLDMGTTYTRIWTQGEGVVLRCPSVAAIDNETHRLVALGVQAKNMLGKTPQDILAYRPIRDGLIAEFEVAAHMLRAMFQNKHITSTFHRPTVLLATPYRINQVQQLAAENTVFEGGAKAVAQVPAIFAAAAGAGLRVSSPRASMILNMGGGISEMAIISSGGIVSARSIRIAGERLDCAIINHLKNRRSLTIGDTTAEELRIRIGTCDSRLNRGSMKTYGLNTRTGLGSCQEVFSSEICSTITPFLREINRSITDLLENVRPEISSDIFNFGLMLSGGCACMPGIADAIHEGTGLRVTIARNPRDCVINGLGRLIRHPELWGTTLDCRMK